jgi:hypothetical protein
MKSLALRNYRRLCQPFGLDPDDFSKLLYSNDCIVSGSFALQCVTGEQFVTHWTTPFVDIYSGEDGGGSDWDIDVYCPSAGYLEVLEFFKCLGYHMDGQPLYPGRSHVEHYEESISVCTVTHLHHPEHGHTADLFCMYEGLPAKTAVAQFDYSFLMTLFDGVAFQTWFPGNVISRSGFYNEVSVHEMIFFYDAVT